MNRIKAIAIIAGVTLTLLIPFPSCEKYVLPAITITPDTLIFNSIAGTQTSVVEANVKCAVTIAAGEEGEEPQWLSCQGMDFAGHGTGTLTVAVRENTGGSYREAEIVVKSETITKRLKIYQLQPQAEQNPQTEEQ